MEKENTAWLEKMGGAVDFVRLWASKAWRIGSLMAKGGYLLTERKRLFGRLGEEVYYKIQKGEWRNAELEPLVKQLEKLSKKIEIEEMLVRSIRFGRRGRLSNPEPDSGV